MKLVFKMKQEQEFIVVLTTQKRYLCRFNNKETGFFCSQIMSAEAGINYL